MSSFLPVFCRYFAWPLSGAGLRQVPTGFVYVPLMTLGCGCPFGTQASVLGNQPLSKGISDLFVIYALRS